VASVMYFKSKPEKTHTIKEDLLNDKNNPSRKSKVQIKTSMEIPIQNNTYQHYQEQNWTVGS
jgi:hypothetical protein